MVGRESIGPSWSLPDGSSKAPIRPRLSCTTPDAKYRVYLVTDELSTSRRLYHWRTAENGETDHYRGL